MVSLVAPLLALPPEPLVIIQGDHGALALAALSDGTGADVELPVGSVATFSAVERPADALRQRRVPRTIAGFCLGGGDLGANVVSYAFTAANTANAGMFDWAIIVSYPTGEAFTFVGGTLEIEMSQFPLAYPTGTGMFIRCTDGGANDGKLVELCGSSSGALLSVPGKVVARTDSTGVVKAGSPAVQVVGLIVATIDMTTLTYGAAGSVDGKTVIANGLTCTFTAPANAAAVASQLVSTFGAGSAGIVSNHLNVAGLVITGGNALTALGLTTAAYSRTYTCGVTFQNNDATLGAWIGPAGIDGTAIHPGFYLGPNGGTATYPSIDVGTLYVYAASGNPQINWAGVDLS